MARFYCPLPLQTGLTLSLPAAAARHVQVLRMQPGQALTLFNGQGGEFEAQVQRMGRSEVEVLVGAYRAQACEAPRDVVLALGMPANERMDWLVEKATELGVTRIVPLMTERTVLRLSGERADKKQAHWQSIAESACEQCGRNRVPLIDRPIKWDDWRAQWAMPVHRGVLSLQPQARTVTQWVDDTMALQSHAHGPSQDLSPLPPATMPWLLLSGPEGGLSEAEDAEARLNGFVPITLGPRVLRAETAALAGLLLLTTASLP